MGTKLLSDKNSIQLPVFDISKPLDSNSLQALSHACKEWGFFHIKNHGISREIMYNKLRSISGHIFGLPEGPKLEVGPASAAKAYTPRFVASPFFESLRVNGPDFFASAQDSASILLHHDDQRLEFSEVLKEYGNKMTELSNRIIEVVLMSLGTDFEKKFYDSEFGNCHGYLRIINYTAPDESSVTCPEKLQDEEIEGLGMHTDMSCVTIVFQDQMGGLQVRSKEGKWMDINPCDQNTLVVNIGDLMQAWSNDKLRSSEHRVVLRPHVGGRFSLAFFWCFEDGKAIFAPEEVVGEEGFRAYKPFVCEDYLKFREISNEEVRDEFEKVGFTVKDFAGISYASTI